MLATTLNDDAAPRVRAGLMTMLERTAAGPRGDCEAVRFDGRGITYRQLRDRSYAVAAGLLAAGVVKGDRVAVLLRNGLEWFELLFAIAEAGAVAVPVNVMLKPNEISHLCRDAQARVVVVDAVGCAALEQAGVGPEIAIGVGGARPAIPGARLVPYEDLFGDATGPTGAVVELEDDLILYYSSGTTGEPKAAVQTHGNVLWNALAQVLDLGLSRDDAFLVVPSLSWAAGFHTVTLPCMWIGARLVVLPTGGATIEKVVGTIVRERVTHTFLVPTLLRRLLASPECQRQLRESSLRWVITGAEPVPLAMITELAEALPGCSFVQGYGMSEFPCMVCVLDAQDAIARAGSAGRPMSICRLAVERADGTIADVGEGEVLVRSPATMTGYWNRPEETAAAFAGGWLHTGDVGRIDDDGYLTIVGRKKDMIISGGLNVYPSETEAVIDAMDGVVESAVVGVPDEHLGEVPVAVVVVLDASVVDAIVPHCKVLLAGYKVPKRVMVRIEPLPRNANGKILKRELRPWALERAAQG